MPVAHDFAQDAPRLERDWGIINRTARAYMPEDRSLALDMALAMDAQPTLQTQPNAGIPAYLTTLYDPEVVRVLQTPNKGEDILGALKKGDWTKQTMQFPVIENTGEVSNYGDFNRNGRSDANATFVQRQNTLFQTIVEYGDLEEETLGLAAINWKAELDISAAKTLNKFMDLINHFGVLGLQTYGLLNDPALSPAITPSTKAAGGVKWINNGMIVASPNEIFADLQALYGELSVQSGGLIDEDTSMVLVVPNTVNMALTAVNSFGLTIRKMIDDTFRGFRIVVDPRYATAAGNVVQMIATEIDGKTTGYCAFSEKQHDHRLVPDLSSYRQKKTAGSYGAVLRYPMAIAQMLGV